MATKKVESRVASDCRFCDFLSTYVSNKHPHGHSLFCRLCTDRSKRTKVTPIVCPLCGTKKNIEVDGTSINQVDVDLIKLVAAAEKDRPPAGSNAVSNNPISSVVHKIEKLDRDQGDLGAQMRLTAELATDTQRKLPALDQVRLEIGKRLKQSQANLTNIASMKNSEQKIIRLKTEQIHLQDIANSQEKLFMALGRISSDYQSVKETLKWLQEKKNEGCLIQLPLRMKSQSFIDVPTASQY